VAEIEVTRTYVEMLRPEDLRAAPPREGARVDRINPCPADLYRFLYGEVGRRYHWVDRRDWTDQEILAHVTREAVSIWVLREGNQTGGFFELVRHDDGSVEIAYFGLLNQYLGRGLGRLLLTVAVTSAWDLGANRVWLHTCTLDHPAALPNYLARGFREFKRERYLARVDGETVSPP
jgi:GNAT superfamily N-acetyltransferase